MGEDALDKEGIIERYKERISKEMGDDKEKNLFDIHSREYKIFRRQYLPRRLSVYEKLCNISAKTLNLKPDPKKRAEIEKSLRICHLNTTPEGTTSFSILAPLAVIIFGALLSYLLFQSTFFILFFLIIAGALIVPLGSLPMYLANNWRMEASNQMVICIFYVATYMRHTSNLENAIDFAAEHISGPLALDMKKVLWDVETGNKESVKESLDTYLETWREWNMEFIEAFHLVEASLYESSEDRRLNMLDKGMSVILSETYEKMLHYAQNLKSPITMLHMLGIIMPLLGLVLLPLIVSFMESVKWFHIFALYNLFLPLVVYFMGKKILARRPTGYGDTDMSQYIPQLKKYKNFIIRVGDRDIAIPPFFIGVLIGVVLFIIGLSPIILHAVGMPDITFMDGKFALMGYKPSKINGQPIGPFGLGATILSLAIPLAFAASVGTVYSIKSKTLIKIRDKTKKLEDEFANGLFQLGNRLGDGLPAELAFGRVADSLQGTKSGEFFSIVDDRMRKHGVGVKDAIFDEHNGALVYFPSRLIESSMKVLLESIKKGPKVAAQALINISTYIKEIHRVNERLKDLLSDIISSMKSQINFMAPAISGIVVGITSMVSSILSKLTAQMAKVSSSGQVGSLQGIAQLFGDGIPTYYFQVIVGLYVFEIIFVLTILENGIENGNDKINENYLLGTNLIRSQMIYTVIALLITIVFNIIAAQIMTSTLNAS